MKTDLKDSIYLVNTSETYLAHISYFLSCKTPRFSSISVTFLGVLYPLKSPLSTYSTTSDMFFRVD